jgi:hypothetical protein
MVDAEFGAQRVELMFASRCTLTQVKETVSKLLTIIRKNGANAQWTCAVDMRAQPSRR